MRWRPELCLRTLCSPRPKLKDKGTVDIKAKDVSLSQTVSVKNDGSGKIAVSSVRCSFDVRKISVKFHGGARYDSMLFHTHVVIASHI